MFIGKSLGSSVKQRWIGKRYGKLGKYMIYAVLRLACTGFGGVGVVTHLVEDLSLVIVNRVVLNSGCFLKYGIFP